MSNSTTAVEALALVDDLLRDATAAIHRAAGVADEVSPRLCTEIMQLLRHATDVADTANRARRALEGAGL